MFRNDNFRLVILSIIWWTHVNGPIQTRHPRVFFMWQRVGNFDKRILSGVDKFYGVEASTWWIVQKIESAASFLA